MNPIIDQLIKHLEDEINHRSDRRDNWISQIKTCKEFIHEADTFIEERLDVIHKLKELL